MEQKLLFSIFGLIFGVIITFVITFILNKSKEKQSDNILEKAKKEAEKHKRDAILELKEEQFKIKQDFEKELKEKKEEAKELDERMRSREESIDRRDQILNDRENILSEKENSITERQKEIQKLEDRANEIVKEELAALEKISGLTKEEACQKEIELIAEYKSNNSDFGYNLTAGGEGPNGYHHTEDAKRKIGNASKGNKYALGAVRTEEFKNNARLKALGRKPSFEAIEKWRKSREGFYHSDETKRKIGEANKGNKNMLGKHHSDETKKRLADVARNRVFSEETREKLRQSAKRQWERYHKKKEEESKDVKI